MTNILPAATTAVTNTATTPVVGAPYTPLSSRLHVPLPGCSVYPLEHWAHTLEVPGTHIEHPGTWHSIVTLMGLEESGSAVVVVVLVVVLVSAADDEAGPVVVVVVVVASAADEDGAAVVVVADAADEDGAAVVVVADAADEDGAAVVVVASAADEDGAAVVVVADESLPCALARTTKHTKPISNVAVNHRFTYVCDLADAMVNEEGVGKGEKTWRTQTKKHTTHVRPVTAHKAGVALLKHSYVLSSTR
jgi:hypothetical protein